MRKGPSQRGVTLTELLVTIVLAGIFFAAAVPLFVYATKQNSADAARNIALNVAQDRVEKIRQLDFDDLKDENLNGEVATFYPGQFGRTYEYVKNGSSKTYHVECVVQDVTPSGDAVAYKQVSVRVWWDAPPAPVKTVELKTVVYKQWSGPQTTSLRLSPPPVAPTPDLFSSAEIAAWFANERWIAPAASQEAVNVYISPFDVPSMSHQDPETNTWLYGWVDLTITDPAGVPTVYTLNAPDPNDGTLYSYFPWTLHAAGDPFGTRDGIYTVSATAFSFATSRGNTVTTRVRYETGGWEGPLTWGGPSTPPFAGGGEAADGSGQVILLWDPCPATDLLCYEVRRFDAAHPGGLVVADAMADPATLLKTNAFTDTGLVYNEPGVYYAIYAVDQTYHYSEAATAYCDWTSAAIKPAAPSGLASTASGSMVTLAWQQPTDTANVSGYQVFRDGQAAPFATVFGQSYEFDQGYESRHTYQVRAFNMVGVVLSDWPTTIAAGQPSEVVNGQPWLVVSIGPEPLFNIRVLNANNQTLSTVQLFFTGPTGRDPAQLVASWQNVTRNTYSSPALTGQHAGGYYVEWQIINPSGRVTSSGSPAFTITPTSSSNQDLEIS